MWGLNLTNRAGEQGDGLCREATGGAELRQILDALPAAIYTTDAQGRLTYNLQTANGNLLTTPFTTSAGLNTFGNDVYVMMLSFRYSFN